MTVAAPIAVTSLEQVFEAELEQWRGLVGILTAGMILLVSLAVWLWPNDMRALPKLLEKVRQRGVGLLKGVTPTVVPCLLVVALYWSGSAAWSHIRPSCAPPLHVPIVTAPENVAAYQKEATRFTENLRDGVCPGFVITIGAAPSLQQMALGLGNNWYRDSGHQGAEPFRRLFGVRPVAWLATSRGEVALVKRYLGSRRTILGESAPAGRDELVVATWTNDLQGQAQRLRSIVKIRELLQDRGVVLDYPLPELSSTGLIAYSLFHRDELTAGDAGAKGTAGAVRPEPDLVEARRNHVMEEDATALLCKVGSMEGREKKKFVMVVPQRSVDAYKAGGVCRGRIPVGVGHDLLEAPGGEEAALENRLVPITWTDQDSERYARVLDDFGQRLSGPEGTAGTGSTSADTENGGKAEAEREEREADLLEKAVNRLADERRPLRLVTVLDSSGSMDSPSHPHFPEIGEAIRDIQPLIAPDDVLIPKRIFRYTENGTTQVLGLFGDEGPEEVSREDTEEFDALLTALRNQRSHGFDADLAAALPEVASGLHTGRPFLVVFTDGGVLDGAGDDGKRVVRTLDGLEAIGGIYVVVLGDQGCPESYARLPEDTPAGKKITCREAGGDAQDGLVEMIQTLRRWRS
ncbi:vWA domain-containing protein [Sinosporangium album]|nr:vWA domain-containing protein [Sinosporangium album]